MLISKFDLYKTEWLDLVFDDRNKEYGAYNLRQHYAGNMVRAMGIAFFSIAVLCGVSIILSTTPDRVKVIHVVNDPYILPPPVKEIKEIKPPVSPKHVKAETLPPVTATTKFVEMVVKPDPQAVTPPKNVELTGAIGTETTKGPVTGSNTPPVETPAGTGTPGPDESVHLVSGLDVMPMPVGGDAAWAKFLNKNLRFPASAQEEGISGKVFLSFIIEKDGHLSNITVDRGAGHGFDEEALRVLKLAKAWKPGMQNGQPVRVKYSIPINFQLSNND
ncbi:energy transducer TonB [Mucilaginibacter sp. OK098]|uniref:energy transducer TonB n=1 Tax=Mucilaginibacter sp. OK098 TaxID=1855297 RepID=UPI00091D1594|nr:energy transducer TonB [Mucilaginibacter sp. OK098]SHM94537.1 protein TonB [Mucilaginibacter sp. OK098]